MAAKTLKTVPIALDCERTIGYNFNAIAALEKATGENPFAQEFWQNVGPTKVRAILWAGLIHGSPSLTIEQVGEMMEVSQMGPYMQAITEAWEANTPTRTEDSPAPQTPAA